MVFRNDKNESLDWDDPLPVEIKDEFSKWIEKIPVVSKLVFNDTYSMRNPLQLTQHNYSFISFVTQEKLHTELQLMLDTKRSQAFHHI